jgi:hypothetical protein
MLPALETSKIRYKLKIVETGWEVFDSFYSTFLFEIFHNKMWNFNEIRHKTLKKKETDNIKEN